MSLVSKSRQFHSTFDPQSYGNCLLWLDGKDSRTMSFNPANGLFRWDSKVKYTSLTTGISPNTNNNPTIVTGSMPGVGFNGTLQYLLCQSISAVPNLPARGSIGGETIFVVATFTGTASRTYHILGPASNTGGTGNGVRAFGVLRGGTPVSNRITLSRLGGSGIGGAPVAAITSNVPFIASSINDGSSGSNRLNGTAGATTTQTSYSYSTFPTSLIGAAGTTISGYYTGTIHELIVYNWIHSNDVPRVEGYLAGKWGMQSVLPAPHPFKSTIPFVRMFYPTDIPGCSLWLDGMDSNTMTISGTSVTQWRDKSGNNRHASNGVSPTTATNGVRFNGTSQYLVTPLSSIPTVANGETILAVVTREPPNTIIGSIVGATVATARTLTVVGSTGIFAWSQMSTGSGFSIQGSGSSSNVIVLATCAYSLIGDGTAHANTYGRPQVIATGGAGVTFTGTGATSYIGVTTSNTFLTNYFRGVIHELIVYDTAGRPSITVNKNMTASRWVRLEAYLAAKWGIQSAVIAANATNASRHLVLVTPIPGMVGFQT
jgi:hypothetical protein